LGQQVKRQSNIELLRIFAMLFIIAHHIAVHSNFEYASNILVVNDLWVDFIQMGGRLGVDIFVLISGYFLITTSTLKVSKVAKLWLQLCTYSVAMYFFFVFLGEESFSIGELLGRFAPITNPFWWFARTYFILVLLSPYISAMLRSLAKNVYRNMLILMTVIWCLLPTFLLDEMESNQLIWFVYLYALAGYIRLHFDVSSIRSRIWFLIALGSILLTYVLALAMEALGVPSVLDPHTFEYFYDMQKLPILVIAVSLFAGFLSWDIGCSKAVNFISAATFGVYMLHDYSDMRGFLWSTVFHNEQFTNSGWLIPYTILQTVVVFAACAGIELVRIYLVEKRYVKCLTRLDAKGFFQRRTWKDRADADLRELNKDA